MQLLIRAIRLRREEISFHEEEDGGRASARAKLLKHKQNLERTTRTIHGNL